MESELCVAVMVVAEQKDDERDDGVLTRGGWNCGIPTPPFESELAH